MLPLAAGLIRKAENMGSLLLIQSDQNMMTPQMRNSYEFRSVQVSSYSGQAVNVFSRLPQKFDGKYKIKCEFLIKYKYCKKCAL